MSAPVDVAKMRRLVEAIDDDTRALTIEEHIEVIRAVPVLLAEVERLRAEIERAVRVLGAFRSAYTLGEANALRVVDLLQTDAEDLAADLRAVLAGGA